MGDRHYLSSWGGVNIAGVLDLFSRRVVGWSLSESLATTPFSEAQKKPIQFRRPDTSSLLHLSDRGCQYTSDDYQGMLQTMAITSSMSRTGLLISSEEALGQKPYSANCTNCGDIGVNSGQSADWCFTWKYLFLPVNLLVATSF